ncbi:hypothetical protein Q084_02086 [Pseudomonas aeruginosa M9A.1]|uniref:hypothetical protein n=2 Tax=Pseudomonas aeruginosa TaxID=287 RepID=UPI0003B96905|nr:hypothetical protein [Pseudomonas aeruginosa]ERU94447.1 hypothetical protein Q084_02086 [Pseudomonas aeruginosa M9A.1]
MSSTQHQLIEQCAIRLRGIVEALDNIHDSTQHRSPHRWSTDLDDVHSSAESLLALINDQAPAIDAQGLAQPSPAQAEQHWPKLEKPAQVGAIRFHAGLSSRLVVEAAQRLYEFESTPEKEAERIERLQAFREQLDPLNLAPHAEAFNEAPDEALRPEQAEAERSALWAVHAQGPDELYAAFSREDAEKHAAELNALPMPEGIAVGAVVVPSPWPAVQHWQYLAEQEQDHKNEIAGRLRQLERICEGLPQDAIDGGWTVQGIRGYAKRLEDQLKAAPAEVEALRAELQSQRERNTELIFKLGSATNGWGRCEKERDAALARVAELEALMQMNFGELHTARNLLSRLSVSGVNVDAILGGQLQDLVIVPADATLEMVEALKRSLTVTNRGTLLNAGHALNASIAASPFAKKAPEPVMCPRCEGEGTLGTGIDESPSTICKRCDGVGTIADAPGNLVPQAWLDVQAERRRQITAEGWTPEHDDEHADGQMAQAAGCYALHAGGIGTDWPDGRQNGAALFWPWDKDSWKPTTPRRDLVKACALALAEIERLDRATATQGGPRDA